MHHLTNGGVFINIWLLRSFCASRRPLGVALHLTDGGEGWWRAATISQNRSRAASKYKSKDSSSQSITDMALSLSQLK
jgi:hypothetical protein